MRGAGALRLLTLVVFGIACTASNVSETCGDESIAGEDLHRSFHNQSPQFHGHSSKPPPAQAAQCPHGWLGRPAPADPLSRESGEVKCYRSPPRIASQVECAGICLEEGRGRTAALACMSDPEDIAFITAGADPLIRGRKHWIGLHRVASRMDEATGLWTSRWAGQYSGHTACPQKAVAVGHSPNWARGRPHAKLSRQDCVILDADGWQDTDCLRAEYRCLCELDANTTSAYFADSVLLRARASLNARQAAQWAVGQLAYGMILPVVVLLVLSMYDDITHNRQVMRLSKVRPRDQPTVGRLNVSFDHSAQLRWRTTHATPLIGWGLMLTGWLPCLSIYMGGGWPTQDLGMFMWYLTLVPIGGALMMMGVQPADARVIRGVACLCAVLWMAIAFLCGRNALRYSLESRKGSQWYVMLWSLFCLDNLGCVAVLVARIYRHAFAAPRLLLLSVWATGRFLICSAGLLIVACFLLPTYLLDPVGSLMDPHMPSLVATAASFMLLPCLFTPANRDQIRRHMASSTGWFCTSPASKEESFERQHYALAASLCTLRRSVQPEAALQLAKRHFSCCTLKVEPQGGGDPAQHLRELRATRRRAEFGRVDAFVSHSQHDDDVLKWLWMREWAGDFHEIEGQWPTVWFDRACIDQTKVVHIEESISALPLIVAGCNRLLVLAGPTYTSRLWTLVEMLAFLWSQQGSMDMVEVVPLLLEYGNAEEEKGLLSTLKRIDVGSASCAHDEDRQLMLAAIESTFGTMSAVNERLCAMLHYRPTYMMKETLRKGHMRLHRCYHSLAVTQGAGATQPDEAEDEAGGANVAPSPVPAGAEGSHDWAVQVPPNLPHVPLTQLKRYEASVSDVLHDIQTQLRRKEREAEEEKLCSVCMKDKKDTALNCGHCYCKTCANDLLRACPMCRAPITQRIKLF